MNRSIILTSLLALPVTLLLSSPALYSQSPTEISDGEDTCRADVEAVYFEATQHVKGYEPEFAVPKLEELRRVPIYDSLSYGCKIKVLRLLVQCYEDLRNAKQREAIVRQLVSEVLRLDRSYDFTAIFTEQSDLDMAERMRAALPAPEPERRRLFSFQPEFDPAEKQEIKVGETKSLRIRTVPQSVPVRLSFTREEPGAQLTQSDSVTTVLHFTADSTTVETVRKIEILGESGDTTRTLTVAFDVKLGGKSNLWKYVTGGVGAVAIGVGAALLLGGGNGEGGDLVRDSLPSPPGPPAGK